jgi:putative sigma-54 modulation protein
MDLLGHDFFFFTNAATERAGVVYRRDDGDVGLIDEA